MRDTYPPSLCVTLPRSRTHEASRRKKKACPGLLPGRLQGSHVTASYLASLVATSDGAGLDVATLAVHRSRLIGNRRSGGNVAARLGSSGRHRRSCCSTGTAVTAAAVALAAAVAARGCSTTSCSGTGPSRPPHFFLQQLLQLLQQLSQAGASQQVGSAAQQAGFAGRRARSSSTRSSSSCSSCGKRTGPCRPPNRPQCLCAAAASQLLQRCRRPAARSRTAQRHSKRAQQRSKPAQRHSRSAQRHSKSAQPHSTKLRSSCCSSAAAATATRTVAEHAIQKLEAEALATQAYANNERSENHVPFHRPTSPLQRTEGGSACRTDERHGLHRVLVERVNRSIAWVGSAVGGEPNRGGYAWRSQGGSLGRNPQFKPFLHRGPSNHSLAR